MDDNTSNTTDADIENMSLISTTDLEQPSVEATGDTTEQAKDNGVDTQTDETTDDTKVIAKDTEAQAQTEQTEAPTKGQPDPEKARQAYQERQRNRSEIAKQIDENYAPKSAEDFVAEEGISQEQAQIKALEARLSFNEQKNEVVQRTADLTYQSSEVLQTLPIFNPASPEYDPEFTNMVDQQYLQVSRFEADDHGNILNAEVPLIDFYKQMADIYSRGATKGSQQAQANAVQMLSRTEAVGGSSSANTSSDLDDLEARLGNVRIA